MAGGIGSVILGFILWRITGNIFIGAVLAVILTPLLGPLLSALLQLPVALVRLFLSLFEPDADLSVLKEIPSGSSGRGMRILILQKGESGGFDSDEKRVEAEAALTSAIGGLYKSSELFRFRFDRVLEENLPIRVCSGRYKTVTEKCFKAWRSVLKNEAFEIGDDNIDVFTPEREIQVEGKKLKLCFFILFDKTLPKPEKTETGDNAAAPAEADGSPDAETPAPVFETAYKMCFDQVSAPLSLPQ